MFFCYFSFGQISVYYSEQEDVYGYSVSATNINWSRDANAENDCKSKGGQNCRQIVSRDGYGCYAIVRGSNQNRGHFIGAAAGNYATNNAINDAKWYATSRGAEEKTLYIVKNGCIDKPKQSQNNDANQSQSTLSPQWSEWKKINSADCDLGIEYRIKKEVHYQLQYQLWFYYEVRNTSNKNIKFEFSLRSKGKHHFGRPHTLSPGGTDSWMHKMFGDYIDSVGVLKVINTKTNKPVCDNADNNQNESSDELNTLLNRLDKVCEKLSNLNLPNDNVHIKKCQYLKAKVWKGNNYNELKDSLPYLEKYTGSGDLRSKIIDLAKRGNEGCNKISELYYHSNPNKYNQLCYAGFSEGAELTQHTLDLYEKRVSDIEKEIDGSENEKQQQEAEKQRLAQEKQDRYNSYIEQGDQAMQNEDYTSAMNHYKNAENSATTDMERSTAQDKYKRAFEAKKTAERKIRVAEQKKRDEQENIAYASGLTAAAGAMALLQDKPSLGFTSGKIYLGLNMEQIPMISNNTNSYHANKSYIEAPFRPGFDLGLIFGIANNKNVSLYLNPKLSYNISAFASGVSGGSVEYGGSALIRGNWNKEFPLKLYAEAGYFKRVGDYHYDADAATQSSGTTTATDDVRDGEYNYSVIRYGGGLMLHQVDEPDEFYVKAGVYFDKPSFYPKGTKPNLGFTLQGMYNQIGSLELYYSPKYFVGGTVMYPSTLERTDKSYFGIRFTRTGRLW